MRVRYSKRALAELESIHHFIAERNSRAARAVVERIEELCTKLAEFPGLGYATDHPPVRVLPVVRYPYLIFYSVGPSEEIHILRIRHGRRRPLEANEI